ncbi:unnamed protein product [Parajaminaea phylloscopi]
MTYSGSTDTFLGSQDTFLTLYKRTEQPVTRSRTAMQETPFLQRLPMASLRTGSCINALWNKGQALLPELWSHCTEENSFVGAGSQSLPFGLMRHHDAEEEDNITWGWGHAHSDFPELAESWLKWLYRFLDQAVVTHLCTGRLEAPSKTKLLLTGHVLP